jgi:hypothetical protein
MGQLPETRGSPDHTLDRQWPEDRDRCRGCRLCYDSRAPGHAGVVRDVAQPPERPAAIALGLAVDGDVEPVVGEAEADRNDMRDRASIGGRQMADPPAVDKVMLARR